MRGRDGSGGLWLSTNQPVGSSDHVLSLHLLLLSPSFPPSPEPAGPPVHLRRLSQDSIASIKDLRAWFSDF